MRALPGVTNVTTFKSKNSSTTAIKMNVRQISLSALGRGLGLFSKAAESETRRRLILTAIALERYKSKTGAYPKTLGELSPGTSLTSSNALVDFMDGKPLRYRLTDEGKFVLYSTGIDCVDNGGLAESDSERPSPVLRQQPFGIHNGKDLVWPRAASDQEVQADEDRKQSQMKKWNAQRNAFQREF